MKKQYLGTPFLSFAFDATSSVPLYRQLYDGIRQAILMGQLPAGTLLPSTRALASQLGISRTTVVIAFDQLLSEGYIQGKRGSGTYVSTSLPDDFLQKPAPEQKSQLKPRPVRKDKAHRLSLRGAVLAAADVATVHCDSHARIFRPGIPDFNHFPFNIWARLAAQHWRHPSHDLLSYTHPAGYFPLRAAIADYLKSSRGVQCTVEQVIIVSGSQQAIDLAARVLLDPGDAVWIEDPGYPGARNALLGANARLVPVPVDAEGLDISSGIARCVDARMAYVTPSYQFPLGATMSFTRRLQLLRWAFHNNAWILEDDYDSEFRYAGRPLSALQGLDTTGQVIYSGTFSKVLFPGLRLGYVVVPPDLVDAFTAARSVVDRHSPIMEQIILADFITKGHFARHILHMRGLYSERQAHLIEAIKRELQGILTAHPAEAGMHLVGLLQNGIDDQIAAQKAAAHQLVTPPLSRYAITPGHYNGLLLGYTAMSIQEIYDGVQRLATAFSF